MVELLSPKLFIPGPPSNLGSCPPCMTGLSLDEREIDSILLWVFFPSSLQRFRPGLGDRAITLLQPPQSPPITSISTASTNDLTAFLDVFTSAFEDFHLINLQPIDETMTFRIN